MKPQPLFLAVALLAGPLAVSLPGATSTDTAPAAAPVTVIAPTESADLAAGYAAAIPQMSLKSLVIYLKSEGKIVPIRGIRSARAFHGVLFIVFSAGDSMAINAGQIVMITDGSNKP